MCGLAGIYNLDGAPINTRQLSSMTRIIQHRGPDDEGFLVANLSTHEVSLHSSEHSIDEIRRQHAMIPTETTCNLGMGFRRLSIIDLSAAGHQPMTEESESCFICFNGQIYNYLEIKEELKSLGHTFRSQSDTEVLLKSYLQWGEHCLQKFIGMFALVIFDKTNKRLFVARDRLGIKPLMYHFNGTRFLWASEEKQLILSGLVSPLVNEEVMSAFLREVKLFERPESFFSEIQQLPAGSYAFVDANGITVKKYWTLQLGMSNGSLEDSSHKVKELLNDAIRLRLRSDVPLGIALSGGIDSSSIACLARQMTYSEINTFSVFYEGPKYDERKYIKAVIDQGGFKPSYFTGSTDLSFEEIAKWIYYQDAPTSGASPFSAFQNYKNVKAAGISVLLNGQGGDELFAGYPYFLKYYIAQLYQTGQWTHLASNIFQLFKDQGILASTKQIYLASQVLKGSPEKLRKLEYKKYATSELYPGEFIEQKNKSKLIAIQTVDPTAISLEQSLLAAITRSHLPHMLRWEDRNSMANSIESRVPFLDHRLVEQSFAIPSEFKIHNGVQKYILRKAMRNIVPESILNRKDKIGFGTPTVEWTLKHLQKPIQELLHSNSFLSRTWIHGKKVQSLYDKNPRLFGENELWRIMTAELWHRTFIDKH
ncbi:MAG: asparagine synthase (glutamine-hydrolyzing) [Saprospiraceae bacterium]|nr:asparagine synthase (glutamine-hydrolyzing) [Saprospiraceae bacterium]